MSSTTPDHTIVQGPNLDLALHTIGWKAFQDLSAQVVEASIGCPVSVYREAQDGGQDATFLIKTDGINPSTVGTVQCKHTSNAQRRLKAADIDQELHKVERLASQGQANTYIFITNMSVDAPVALVIGQKLREVGVENPQIWGKEKIVLEVKSSSKLRALVPQVYGLGDLSSIMDARAVKQTKELLGHWLPKLKSYVTTTAHAKAVHAIEKYRTVLLLGNPSSGKSTIGAILSTIAAEDGGHDTIKLTSPHEFKNHWNTDDRRRFFWFDDAFGSNVLRDDYVQEWASIFSSVQTAITQGNRVLFTSRNHIYIAAMRRLGQRNLPVFRDRTAVVEVGQLTDEEKSQILYNHINFGTQSSSWKTAAKPFLAAVAKKPNFLPGIAERLGNPAFTKKLPVNHASLVGFMSQPRQHLVEVIEELDDVLNATLVLIYASQGQLNILDVNSEAMIAIEASTGIKYAEISNRVHELEGSFLRLTKTAKGQMWEFEHPTIADALTEILEKKPQMLAALLRGAKIDKILREFVCEGADSIVDAFTVPSNFNNILVRRLSNTPDEPRQNQALFEFLDRRADDAVFREVIKNDEEVLNRRFDTYGTVIDNPRVRVHAKAFSMNLLPESLRKETTRHIVGKVTGLDLSFLQDDRILALVPPLILVSLGSKIRMEIEAIGEEISAIGEGADLEADAEGHFSEMYEALGAFEALVSTNADDDEVLKSAYESIQNEITSIEERQADKREEERWRRRRDEEEEQLWNTGASQRYRTIVNHAKDEKSGSSRSIFDDVDE